MTRRIYRKKPVSKQKFALPTPDIWRMPPYIVARFGGELSQIMLNAAENYIVEKCLSIVHQEFNEQIPEPENSAELQ